MRAHAVIGGLDPRTPLATIQRLVSGVCLVHMAMIGREWLTYFEIQQRVERLPCGKHFSEACISARIRDQRKEKHGAHTVNRRVRRGTCNLYEYQLISNNRPEAA
jgi:hypothetical protein